MNFQGLKRCPFCGNDGRACFWKVNTITENKCGDQTKTTHIKCGQCGATGPDEVSKYSAEFVWNKRATRPRGLGSK